MPSLRNHQSPDHNAPGFGRIYNPPLQARLVDCLAPRGRRADVGIGPYEGEGL